MRCVVYARLKPLAFHFSCHGNCTKKRDRLILPAFVSSRVYIINTGSNPKAPSIFKVNIIVIAVYYHPCSIQAVSCISLVN